MATVPQIIAQLYDAFAIRDHYLHGGNAQAVGNLEKLREYARKLFSNEQALTLRQFVDMLRTNMLSGAEESEAMVASSDTFTRPKQVRIITIHRAKGLEFPIVIIPEVQKPLTNDELAPSFLVNVSYG